MTTLDKQKEEPELKFTDRARKFAAPILDPIAELLLKWRVGPDFLTVAGMVGHILTAYLIANGLFSWAAVSILLIAPLDALDGALARKMTKQARPFGAFLDSTLDRVAEIILFGGFIIYFYNQSDLFFLTVSYVAITGSLMVSYSRSKAEALGYDGEVGLLGRLERYILLFFFLLFQQVVICLFILACLTYVTFIQRMVHVWRQSQPNANHDKK